LISVPSVNRTFSTNASTLARTSTFCGESSWPMISVCIGALVAVKSRTWTVGGGRAAGAAFLQEMDVIAATTASNASHVGVTRTRHGRLSGGEERFDSEQV
jgi:hypothetical protein